jgi:hypothetical protein
LSFEELLKQEDQATTRSPASDDQPSDGDIAAIGAESAQELVTSTGDAAVGGDAASPPPGEIKQLDEFLAGQADDAVAGDFETVHDVMAAQQAVAADGRQGVVEPAASPDKDSGNGGATSTCIDNSTVDATTSPCDDEQGTYGGQRPHGVGERKAAQAPGPRPSPTAAATPSATAGAPKKRRPMLPRLGATAVRTTAAAVRGALAATRGACTALSAPLNRLPENQRNLLGYAGVISLINGALLLLARAFNLLG